MSHFSYSFGHLALTSIAIFYIKYFRLLPAPLVYIISGPPGRCYLIWLFVATLYLIYKLRVSQLYDTGANESTLSIHSKVSGDQHNDEPFAIQHINLCPRSRVLAVTTLSNAVIVYRFRSKETAGELSVCFFIICSFQGSLNFI